ncbi:hypothetical protein BH09MYX1_BH09MYX1_59330 [soil metagenome]
MPSSTPRKRLLVAAIGLVAVGGLGAIVKPHARRAAAAAMIYAPNRGAPEPAPITGEIRIPVQNASIAVELVAGGGKTGSQPQKSTGKKPKTRSPARTDQPS